MIYAGIAAGGIGSRMRQSVPKQFIHINDEPIIIHTIRKFTGICDKIYIACNEGYVEYLEELIGKYIGNKNIKVIVGGSTRMESILHILSEISAVAKDDDILITHDGVRPFVTEEIIKENIECAKKYGASGTFINAVDTMAVSVDGKRLTAVPARDTIFNVQTPQTFKTGVLKEIFKAAKEDMEKYTDLCGMAMAFGHGVRMVQGDAANIKITNPIDLQFAQSIMRTSL